MSDSTAFSEMMPEQDYVEYFGSGFHVGLRGSREEVRVRESKFDRNVRLGKLILVKRLAVRKAAQVVGVHKCTATRLLQRLAPRELGRIVQCARCSKDVRCGPHAYLPRRYCHDCRIIVRRMTQRLFKQRHKDRVRVSRQSYYRRNRTQLIAKSIQWAKANPEKQKAKERRYRRRRLEALIPSE